MHSGETLSSCLHGESLAPTRGVDEPPPAPGGTSPPSHTGAPTSGKLLNPGAGQWASREAGCAMHPLSRQGWVGKACCYAYYVRKSCGRARRVYRIRGQKEKRNARFWPATTGGLRVDEEEEAGMHGGRGASESERLTFRPTKY